MFQGLGERVAELKDQIASAAARGGHGQQVTLVAVTKTHGADAVLAAHSAGLQDVGENKVQEALGKMDEVDVPLRWHLIGHLQRNKAKHVVRFALVHSIDSERLAAAVDVIGRSSGSVIDVLLQVNISGEESKGGFEPGMLPQISDRLLVMHGLRVRGVMTMAPFEAGERVLRSVFGGARDACAVLRAAGHPATELSMGMSGDFVIAVEEGATLVRLGSALFGARMT